MRFGHRFESRYYQKPTLSEDLIVAWELDETSGTRYPYYGGSEFNLTDVNTVGTADAPPGIGGLCASFNASNTEYLYCADPFPPPLAFSVSAWVYVYSLSVYHGIVGQDVSPNRMWLLYIGNTNATQFILSADGTAITVATGGAVSSGEWTLVTGVWNGTNVVVYKNLAAGVPVAFSGPVFNGTANLAIGARSGGALLCNGRIAQPLIWRRALTLTEITYLYNSGNGRPLSDWL